MVAVIGTGTSLHRPFLYNENKVEEKAAICIAAVGYPKDLPELTKAQKLNRLLNQAALHTTAKRKGIHISLNFDPSEKDISDDKLIAIAAEYMQAIGFGDQPCLIYRHHDAAHPHIHIVSTTIAADGSRINTQNIGKEKSEPASRLLEKKYGLVPADKRQRSRIYRPEPIAASVIAQGEAGIRRKIQSVLAKLLRSYNYTSMAELNALLSLSSVNAYTGDKGSRTLLHDGLYYRIVRMDGEPVVKPVKASRFFIDMPQKHAAFRNRPTKAYLKQRFMENFLPKKKHRTRLKNLIDLALLTEKKTPGLKEFMAALHAQGVDLVLRQNREGHIYGITYVDHNSRCVFNGSDLGKTYGASGILQRCNPPPPTAAVTGREQQQGQLPTPREMPAYHAIDFSMIPSEIADILERLFGPEYTYQPVPYEMRPGYRKRRRKKRKKW
jgi:hypothetical protein